MEPVFGQMLATLMALWWPFVRVLAILSFMPVIGENMVPVTVRVLLALTLAVVLLPVAAPPTPISPFSLLGIVTTIEQVAIGLIIGIGFQMIMAVFALLGYMASSQMGLAMAQMNDPMSGASSDVVSALIYVLVILIFFAVDGHLVFSGVMGSSFRAWPVGAGIPEQALTVLSLQVGWVFSAALLLSLPVIFSALVVQIGFGFLNRVAPTFNLFSLGFSLIIVFGLFMLGGMLQLIPQQYVNLTTRVLEMLEQLMRN